MKNEKKLIFKSSPFVLTRFVLIFCPDRIYGYSFFRGGRLRYKAVIKHDLFRDREAKQRSQNIKAMTHSCTQPL